MELSDFVQQSLIQITEGVKNSQEKIKEMGGFASPVCFQVPNSNSGSSHFGSVTDGQNVLLVDFDVAVTVTDSAERTAGGKLSVATIFKSWGGGKQQSS